MSNQYRLLDETDMQILKILQDNCKFSIAEIAKKLEVPYSTIQYRIKRLEANEIILGYHAQVNIEKIGKDYTTITFVRAKYGESNFEELGKTLAQIPGVFGVYFVLGEDTFVVLCTSDNREDLGIKLKMLYNNKEIERTRTIVVMKTIKGNASIF